jgi:serine/threonine protein kinase
VTDFGFSQLKAEGDESLKDQKGPKGSALWMAPEVVKMRRNLFGIVVMYIYIND